MREASEEPAAAVPVQAVVLAMSAVMTSLLLLLLVIPPAPYAIESPGPTVDTLGEVDGEPLIRIAGAPTYATDGALSLTTVAAVGGPNNPVGLARVLQGWFSATDGVVPVEKLYPRNRTADELTELLQAQMTSSQENATVAALTELGYDVPAELRVAGVVEGSGSDGVLVAGDVLLAAAGSPLATFQDLADLLSVTAPGTGVEVELLRDGERTRVPVVTGEHAGGGSELGVLLDPTFDLPVDVDIRIEEIGGPSAGLVFALGIVDLLTPGAMTGGTPVAGTGTISLDGEVGPISGVRKKMLAAARDDASFFLAPAGNCDEVLGAVPEGLTVIAVATLGEARAALERVGEGDVTGLPACG